MQMLRLLIAIVSATYASVGDACAIVTVGRLSLGVDGLSGECCSSMKPLADQTAALALKFKETHQRPPQKETQELQAKLMSTFMGKCCDPADQEVLSTLLPNEPAQAVSQMKMMCSGGPHEEVDVLEMLGATSLLPNSTAPQAKIPKEISLGGKKEEKNKIILAVLVLFGFGTCGIDRCFLGDACLGVVKGITLGGVGVWAIVDYVVLVINLLSKSEWIDTVGIKADFADDTIVTAFWFTLIIFIMKVLSCVSSFLMCGASCGSLIGKGREKCEAAFEAVYPNTETIKYEKLLA